MTWPPCCADVSAEGRQGRGCAPSWLLGAAACQAKGLGQLYGVDHVLIWMRLLREANAAEPRCKQPRLDTFSFQLSM